MKSLVLYGENMDAEILEFCLPCESEEAEDAARKGFAASQKRFVVLTEEKWGFLFEMLALLKSKKGLGQIEETFLKFILQFYNAAQTS